MAKDKKNKGTSAISGSGVLNLTDEESAKAFERSTWGRSGGGVPAGEYEVEVVDATLEPVKNNGVTNGSLGYTIKMKVLTEGDSKDRRVTYFATAHSATAQQVISMMESLGDDMSKIDTKALVLPNPASYIGKRCIAYVKYETYLEKERMRVSVGPLPEGAGKAKKATKVAR